MTLTNYWLLLAWILIPGFALKEFGYRNSSKLSELEYGDWSKGLAWILSFPYVLWATFRPDTMGDTGAYHVIISHAPRSVGEWPAYLSVVTKDKGFSVLILLINLFAENKQVIIFFIIAMLQMGGLVYLFRKYSCDYWLSIFIFVASTDYISWMQNGIRQFTAVTIILFSSGFIFRKKYVKAILLILLAATMHQSALIMIPIIFIVQGEAWNKKTILCVIGAVAAIFFVDQFTNILERLLSDTQYTNIVTDWNDFGDNGTNPIRVLFYSMPTILSLVGLRYIRYESNPVINICVNMSIVSTAIYIISMGTSGIFIGRLPIYASLYSMNVLLPWEINHMFTEKSAKLVTLVLCAVFCGFYYFQMKSWGLF